MRERNTREMQKREWQLSPTFSVWTSRMSLGQVYQTYPAAEALPVHGRLCVSISGYPELKGLHLALQSALGASSDEKFPGINFRAEVLRCRSLIVFSLLSLFSKMFYFRSLFSVSACHGLAVADCWQVT